jgi:hypothetical protein
LAQRQRHSILARDQEPAAASLLFSHEVKTGRGVFRPLDDHVLKQIAEAGFHRAFVSSLDLEVIGDGSALSDLPFACARSARGASPYSARRA